MKIIEHKGQLDLQELTDNIPGPVSKTGEFLLMNWTEALSYYRYPVDFSDFQKSPGIVFKGTLGKGDRNETMEFENYFRQNAQNSIRPWREVVFWKMFSQKGAGKSRANTIIEKMKQNHLKSQNLWERCMAYANTKVEDLNRSSLEELLEPFKTRHIATVLTFPAFIRPQSFPMTDRQVANWVLEWHDTYTRSGSKLTPPTHSGPLTIADFDFVKSWTVWCRSKSKELPPLHGEQWRARDVEMAVFTVQRLGSAITGNQNLEDIADE